MTYPKKITYEDKENNRPIIERKKQATAEDFQELKDVINDNFTFFTPKRVSISATSTNIAIPNIGGVDYEVEVIAYTTSDRFGNATGLVSIPDASKTSSQFTVSIPSGYENGTLIYRILDFNL